ncbi:MAG: diguanylate cyclase, partial [Fusobacteriaceae bacterium]
ENPKTGVIEKSIEDYISREYYTESNIIRYKNAFELEKALKEDKVSAILHVNSYLAGVQGFNSDIFYSFPMNIAFHRENEMLRNIYNKAYKHFVDIDLLKERMIESEKKFSTLKVMEAEHLKKLLYRSVVFFLLFILFILTLFFIEKRKKTKELEEIAFFDILSTLGNRYNFNRACKEFNSREGICIVADLDDFKKANDTHGHHIGDEIIKYYGMVLKNIFGEKNTFRISGDEYYIFVPRESFEKQLEDLKIYLENSETIKKYSVYMSLGYFFKNTSADIFEGFKKADSAMYRAKSEKGHSFYSEE